jgi:hypothetical protein
MTRPRPAFGGSTGANNRPASTDLHGVKRDDWRAYASIARKLGRDLAQRGEIAYSADEPDRAANPRGRREQRDAVRKTVRLRSAKLLDAAYGFVCECRICDRSQNGLRLAAARKVELPRRLAVHIDETGEIRGVNVVWRRGPLIGVRLEEPAPLSAISPADRYALRERYYGILA